MDREKIHEIIINNLPHGFSLVDREGVIIEFNRAAERTIEGLLFNAVVALRRQNTAFMPEYANRERADFIRLHRSFSFSADYSGKAYRAMQGLLGWHTALTLTKATRLLQNRQAQLMRAANLWMDPFAIPA